MPWSCYIFPWFPLSALSRFQRCVSTLKIVFRPKLALFDPSLMSYFKTLAVHRPITKRPVGARLAPTTPRELQTASEHGDQATS
ncbi:hypothetical protein CONLIGDRAFT_629211 [Coniochaeta ligniaria NRRL 30616]|uniref:Uncharacterized protein n=1 Tax=Coniochaeta ligniaria NRRL 30616 TaxID=1408157 RepID=A0A1J7IW60_9PEZI|nr:hypothetical protein CONLIGDRAFT_629211 [Coniochaeta ligniaria NRRL 30616]